MAILTGNMMIRNWICGDVQTNPYDHIKWWFNQENMDITRNQLFKVAVSTDPKYTLVNVDHNPIWDERYKKKWNHQQPTLFYRWRVNVLIEHHPNIGDIISNRYVFKWCSKFPSHGTFTKPCYSGFQTALNWILWAPEKCGNQRVI